MTDSAPSRLVVEAVHRISGRPWILVTGVLEGGVLHVGDHVVVRSGNGKEAGAVVRSIELHGPPGRTTVALDEGLASNVGPGTDIVSGRTS